MGYILSADRAQYGAELTRKMLEAFPAGHAVIIETRKPDVGYAAFKAREALRALKEYPDLIPEGALNLIMDREYIIKAVPQEGRIFISPRGRINVSISVGNTFEAVSAARNGDQEVNLDCIGTRLQFASDWIPVVGALQRGVRKVINTNVPNDPVARDAVNSLFLPFGFEVERFNPPGEITFKQKGVVE